MIENCSLTSRSVTITSAQPVLLTLACPMCKYPEGSGGNRVTTPPLIAFGKPSSNVALAFGVSPFGSGGAFIFEAIKIVETLSKTAGIESK